MLPTDHATHLPTVPQLAPRLRAVNASFEIDSISLKVNFFGPSVEADAEDDTAIMGILKGHGDLTFSVQNISRLADETHLTVATVIRVLQKIDLQ